MMLTPLGFRRIRRSGRGLKRRLRGWMGRLMGRFISFMD